MVKVVKKKKKFPPIQIVLMKKLIFFLVLDGMKFIATSRLISHQVEEWENRIFRH